MEFIDHTGHIFSMPFYSKYPIGYEYETNPYIFWLNGDTDNLSINTYYIKPIYALFNETENFEMNNLKISVNSNIYKLIGSKQIQELLENNKSFKENINLDYKKDSKTELSLEDINFLKIKRLSYYTGTKKYNVYKENKTLTFYRNLNNGTIYTASEFRNLNLNTTPLLYKDNEYFILHFETPGKTDINVFINEFNGVSYKIWYESPQSPISNFDWNIYLNNNQIIEDKYLLPNEDNTYSIIESCNENEEKYYYLEKGKKIYIEDENNINSDGENLYIIKDINHTISIEEYNELKNDTECNLISRYKNYILIPFYIIGLAEEEGTWTSNVLIDIYNDEEEEHHYTHITVGGVFKDNIEELVINGRNMGISLPKEIIKAVYNSSYYSDTINEELYNEKLKEYLMNFMLLKGEQGNFKSALAGLEWFGWGDNIEISKLLQTDNTILNQYIRDYFNIKTDLIEAYNFFRNSTYISLTLKENIETEKENPYNFDESFWGENKPIMENLFNKTVSVKYDESGIDFYKGYYDFLFDEISLKLSLLKYYYSKYFLPIHLYIKSASIEHKVYLNDIKYIVKSRDFLQERISLLKDNNIYVEFDKNKYYTLEVIEDEVDENLNKTNKKTDNYKINALGVKIPIYFKSNINDSKYLECILSVIVGNTNIYTTNFSFVQNFEDEESYYKYFCLLPQYIVEKYKKDVDDKKGKFDLNYWINNEITLLLYVNGNYYTKKFKLKEPILNLEIGTLNYQYYENNLNESTPFDQFKDDFTFKSFMWDSGFVTVNDLDFNKKLSTYRHINDNEKINNSLSNYYIEDELLNNYYTENEIKNIYEKKSFSLNDSLYPEIEYLYFYNNDNLYKKFQKIDILLIKEISEYLLFINPSEIYEYDFNLNIIRNIDILKYKSFKKYFFKINEQINNNEIIPVSPLDLYEYCNIYYKTETDFIKVENIEQIDNNEDYYIEIQNDVLLYYKVYEKENDTLVEKINKAEKIYNYLYFNNDEDEYDYIEEIDYKNINLNDLTNKYIFKGDYNLYAKENKTWYNLLKLSNIKVNITNNKYYNRIILYDIYKDNEIYQYIKENEETDFELLREKLFYQEDICDINNVLCYKKGSSKYILYDDYPYDIYLMHDDKQWYCIFISRKTINNINENRLKPNKEKQKIKIDNNIFIKYVKGSNRFLINRFNFIQANGYNHFKKDDIIVISLKENKNIGFKYDMGCKWEIIPKTIGIPVKSKITSNTNTFIFSMLDDNLYHEKGFYSVKVRYSVDDYIQHQKEKSCIIKIE